MPDQCSSSDSAPLLRVVVTRKLILPVAEPRYRLQAWRISLPPLGSSMPQVLGGADRRLALRALAVRAGPRIDQDLRDTP
jgi:hypothetical protein